MRYFDHAATTMMRPVAREAWLNASRLLNPVGQYQVGRKSRRVLDVVGRDEGAPGQPGPGAGGGQQRGGAAGGNLGMLS